MGYTPNNPYIPGDPYSYDLKWLVQNLNKIKENIIQLEKTYTTPTVVDIAAEMTDVNKIYVYIGTEPGYLANHWYFYDTDTNLWTDGGVYGSLNIDDIFDNLTPTAALDDSDYVIINDGSTSEKIRISDALAGTSHPGFISHSDQTIGGKKSFNDSIVAKNSVRYPSYSFESQGDDESAGEIYIDTDSNTPGVYNRTAMAFEVKAAVSANDELSQYYERYKLPSTTPGITEDKSYVILTTKNVKYVDHEFTNITVPSSGFVDLGTFGSFGVSGTVISMIIRGWSNSSGSLSLIVSGNGANLYLMASSPQTISNFTVRIWYLE